MPSRVYMGVLLAYSLVLPGGSGAATAAATRSAVHDAVEVFVESGSIPSWENAVLTARTGSRDSVTSPYSVIVDYYIYAMKRDLPNSMARSSGDPLEQSAALCRQLRLLVDTLRSRDQSAIDVLLRRMATSEDDSLAGVAAEIAKRLSQTRYSNLEVYVKKTRPGRLAVFRERGAAVERDPSIINCNE